MLKRCTRIFCGQIQISLTQSLSQRAAEISNKMLNMLKFIGKEVKCRHLTVRIICSAHSGKFIKELQANTLDKGEGGSSGLARAFLGRRLAHPEDQFEHVGRHRSSVIKFSLWVQKVPGSKTQQGQNITCYTLHHPTRDSSQLNL